MDAGIQQVQIAFLEAWWETQETTDCRGSRRDILRDKKQQKIALHKITPGMHSTHLTGAMQICDMAIAPPSPCSTVPATGE